MFFSLTLKAYRQASETRENRTMYVMHITIINETDVGLPSTHALDHRVWHAGREEVCRTTGAKRMT